MQLSLHLYQWHLLVSQPPDHYAVWAGLQATVVQSILPQKAPLIVLPTSRNYIQIEIDHDFGLTCLGDKNKPYSCQSQVTSFL